jgi:hypothetical protein
LSIRIDVPKGSSEQLEFSSRVFCSLWFASHLTVSELVDGGDRRPRFQIEKESVAWLGLAGERKRAAALHGRLNERGNDLGPLRPPHRELFADGGFAQV